MKLEVPCVCVGASERSVFLQTDPFEFRLSMREAGSGLSV